MAKSGLHNTLNVAFYLAMLGHKTKLNGLHMAIHQNGNHTALGVIHTKIGGKNDHRAYHIIG